jgi:hypothetical protein
MTLLRYISEPALREQVLRATNKAEAYNGFAQWLFFGNFAVIADNDPDDQETAIKFNTLLANLVILSTTLDMTVPWTSSAPQDRRSTTPTSRCSPLPPRRRQTLRRIRPGPRPAARRRRPGQPVRTSDLTLRTGRS